MNDQFDIAKKFKTEVVEFFSSITKTGWGKIEVTNKIKDLWAEFLEKYVSWRD